MYAVDIFSGRGGATKSKNKKRDCFYIGYYFAACNIYVYIHDRISPKTSRAPSCD